MGQEIMVCRGVETWARSTDVDVVVWCHELVSSVARCWDQVTALLVANNAVLCVVVWVLGGHWSSWDVVGVEWAGSGASCTSAWLLSSNPSALCLDQARVNAFNINHEREGSSPRNEEGGNDGALHDSRKSLQTSVCWRSARRLGGA